MPVTQKDILKSWRSFLILRPFARSAPHSSGWLNSRVILQTCFHRTRCVSAPFPKNKNHIKKAYKSFGKCFFVSNFADSINFLLGNSHKWLYGDSLKCPYSKNVHFMKNGQSGKKDVGEKEATTFFLFVWHQILASVWGASLLTVHEDKSCCCVQARDGIGQFGTLQIDFLSNELSGFLWR